MSLICVLIVAALLLAAAPASAVVFHPDVRVLLSLGAPDEVTIKTYGGYTIKEAPDFRLEDGEKYTVSRSGSRVKIEGASGSVTAASLTFVNPDYSGTGAYLWLRHTKYGACTYLGDMRFDITDGGVRAINTLPLESYLYGVVPHEMSNTFPLDALKAQAVCARGYAVACCSSGAGKDYDILDTSQDQVYHGYASRYTRAIQAVDETKGEVLSYDGDMVKTYYSASNGGQTELTGNVWSGDLPYYVQLDDEYDLMNTSSLEEKSFIPEQFTTATRALMDEYVLTLLQDAANKAAGGDVTLIGTVRVRPYAAKYDAPSRCYTKADVVLMVMKQDGSQGQIIVTLDLTALKYDAENNPDGIFGIASTNLRMMGAERGVYTLHGEEYPGFYLTNRRYGHGVGLSQRGAQQRAAMGESYLDILGFYYANTTLLTVGDYATAPKIESGTYSVTAYGISNIQPGTDASKFMAGLHVADASIYLADASGAEKSGTVGTGDLVRMTYGENTVYLDLPLIVYGDLDGNGKINKDDVELLLKHLINTERLGGAYLLAADVDHDGDVTAWDALRLQKSLYKAYTIDQSGGTGE